MGFSKWIFIRYCEVDLLMIFKCAACFYSSSVILYKMKYWTAGENKFPSFLSVLAKVWWKQCGIHRLLHSCWANMNSQIPICTNLIIVFIWGFPSATINACHQEVLMECKIFNKIGCCLKKISNLMIYKALHNRL